ncbi:hypothetical protein EYF80_043174 [Liparis tanakae]|uniref:Uncharacterized protein n=1 Tax=Liparis tanakae TaxID=230148 RepID=A0A4Z2G053_9TELE|nr:hypothetical protein EYF80_043174 [Liparis tanakae]
MPNRVWKEPILPAEVGFRGSTAASTRTLLQGSGSKARLKGKSLQLGLNMYQPTLDSNHHLYR